MASSKHLNLYLLLFFMQLGIVASIQRLITSHCDGQDCEIKIRFQDAKRGIILHTRSNDSVVTALLQITSPRNMSSEQNDLVNFMGNVAQMLSSMIHGEQINRQQLYNMVQQFHMESQPSITAENLYRLNQKNPEPEILLTTQYSNHQQLDDTVEQLDMESQPSHTSELLTSPKSEILMTQQIETNQAPMKDCSNALSTGLYSISPLYSESDPFVVVCDMNTTSGGWIVIQRRFDGSVSFDRNWVDYENGFGSLDGEFWLGLSKMHTITQQGVWKLRFDLEDFKGNHVYAEYDFFRVGDSASNYQLTIRSYSGDAGDSMIKSHNLNRMAFTTKDRDNDKIRAINCGRTYGGGWWHNKCARSNINGIYYGQGFRSYKGMVWYQWKRWTPLKKAEMKIRRLD